MISFLFVWLAAVAGQQTELNSTTTTTATATTTSATTLATTGDGAQLLVLRDNAGVQQSFEEGDVVIQVPGSVFEAGVRQLVVKSGSSPSAVGAVDINRSFAAFVALSTVPPNTPIGPKPIVVCLATALFSGAGRLCWAAAAVPGGSWNCTDAAPFASDSKTCARIDSLAVVNATARAFSFVAVADIGVAPASTSSARASTLPVANSTTLPLSLSVSFSRVCKVGETEGGVLCDLNSGVRSTYDDFLALGDTVVGIVIAAIVLCILCCCGLICFLFARPSRSRSAAATDKPEPPSPAAIEQEAAVREFLEPGKKSKPSSSSSSSSKRKIVHAKKARHARESSFSSSSSSDNYDKFEAKMAPARYDDASHSETEEEPSEQVIVFQEVAVETAAVIERDAPSVKKKKKKSTSQKKKKKQSPSSSSSSKSASASSSSDLQWAQVESIKTD